MRKAYVLTPEFKEHVQQVVAHYLQNFQPRPKKSGRRRQITGGNSDSGRRIIVKITSGITGREGTTFGEGVAIELDENLDEVSGEFQIYNISTMPYIGSSGEPLYTFATQIGNRYIIDAFDMHSIEGFGDSAKQGVFHAEEPDAAIEWKTLVEEVISEVAGIELNLDSSELEVVLNYTPVTFLVWPDPTDGSPAAFTDSVDVTPCP